MRPKAALNVRDRKRVNVLRRFVSNLDVELAMEVVLVPRDESVELLRNCKQVHALVEVHGREVDGGEVELVLLRGERSHFFVRLPVREVHNVHVVEGLLQVVFD